jgi:hypothetical protein
VLNQQQVRGLIGFEENWGTLMPLDENYTQHHPGAVALVCKKEPPTTVLSLNTTAIGGWLPG